MAGVLGFQSAAALGPSPSETEQLRDLCSCQAEQLERLQDLATEPQPAARLPHGAIIRPEEKQALIELLSTLAKRVEDLEKLTGKQADEIEALKAKKSEQLGLLRDGIVRMQGQLEDLESRISLDIALDRQRITRLELPEHIQPKQKDRADMLRLLLAANGGKMLSKDARHRLGLSESQFSQLLKTLKGLVEARPLHTDGRQHVITLVKALTNDGT